MTTQQRIERIAKEFKESIQELVKAGSLSESLGEHLIERNEAALTAFAEEEEQAAIETRKEFYREEKKCPNCGSFQTTPLFQATPLGKTERACRWCATRWQPLPEAPKED